MYLFGPVIYRQAKKYSSNIDFVFNDHFSLHEPNIEILDEKIKIPIKNKNVIKTKKTRKIIKKNIVKKTQSETKIKKKKTKKTSNLKKQDIKINKKIVKKEEIVENMPEKSGWWSE